LFAAANLVSGFSLPALTSHVGVDSEVFVVSAVPLAGVAPVLLGLCRWQIRS